MFYYYRKISLIMLLLIGMTFAAQAQKTPLEFNDELAVITDSLGIYSNAWNESAKSAFAGSDFSQLKARRQSMEAYIDNRIASLKKMKDIKNSKALREAMISFLTFEKSTILVAMKTFEGFSAATGDEEKKKAIEHLTETAAKEEETLAAVSKEQAAYAKANGFSLGEETPE